jgi:hypothetical protein
MVPNYELDMTITKSPYNPIGAKGVGESGCVSAPPAITNAVMDALAPLGVLQLDMPASSARVWAAIRRANGSSLERRQYSARSFVYFSRWRTQPMRGG